MADGAVLAHHVLVLEHDAGERPVIFAGVGAAHEVHHLVSLDAGGARINRVGADAGEVVDLPRRDGAVAGDADFGAHAMVAGMDVGDEALSTVGHELDGSAQELRERHGRHLVRIGVDLDAERAAHVLGDDADLVLFQPQVLREQVLHHVGRLRALVDGEALIAGIPVGNNSARLVGDAGVAAEPEGRLDDFVRQGEATVGIAGRMAALEAEIVAERRVDHGRRFIECGLGIGDGRQFLVVDDNKRTRILRLRPRARHHGGHRLALPARDIDGDGVLGRRFDALEVGEHADPRRDDSRQRGAGDDRNHARRGFRGRRIDRGDARVGVRRAHERHVRHARQRHVAHILPAPLGEARQIRPRHRAADVGVRPIEGSEF